MTGTETEVRLGALAPVMTVSVEHTASPVAWQEHPGVEWWSASLWLSFDEASQALVARSFHTRIDNNQCLDLFHELDSVDYELGVIAGAIDRSPSRLLAHSIAGGMNTSFVTVDSIVVDKYWRGQRLGPSLVHLLADLLRADAVFLIPSALGTRLNASGECYADPALPRGGSEANAKVRECWKRAGFRKLTEDVMWHAPSWKDGAFRESAWAKTVISQVEESANTAQARGWWRRRVARRTRASSFSGTKRRAHYD